MRQQRGRNFNLASIAWRQDFHRQARLMGYLYKRASSFALHLNTPPLPSSHHHHHSRCSSHPSTPGHEHQSNRDAYSRINSQLVSYNPRLSCLPCPFVRIDDITQNFFPFRSDLEDSVAIRVQLSFWAEPGLATCQ